MLNIGFLEKVYLRGIEGLISDEGLKEALVAKVPAESERFMNAIDFHMEAKHMAEQVFFQMRGLGL